MVSGLVYRLLPAIRVPGSTGMEPVREVDYYDDNDGDGEIKTLVKASGFDFSPGFSFW